MPSEQEDRDYVDLQQYWLILKRRWLVTATMIGSVFGITALASFTQKPVYEAQGKLLLKQQSGASSLTGLSEKVGELSGLTNLSNPLETEAEVIRSNPLVQKTIDKLQLKDKQGQPLGIGAFVANLKVKGIRGTDVMELSYRSTNQEEAAGVINDLMNSYLDNNIRTNRAEATAAKDFLRKQLPQIEKTVVEAEAALRQFKDKNQVVSLAEEAKVGVEGLRDLSEEITKAQAELAGAKSRSVGLQSQLELTTRQAVNLSSLSQSPGVQQVLTEYQKVQDEMAVAQTRLTAEHPTIQNLMRKGQALREQLEKRVGQIVSSPESVTEPNLQIGQLKQTLTAELVRSEVERLALVNRVGVLQKAFLSYHARMKALPKLEEQQRALERKLQVAQSTYQQVLKQLQETEVIEQQKVGNARIISEALVPQKPVSPKIALNLALGGFLGVLLGVGTALLLEAMDKSLKNSEEAKRLLGYPLLGSIPQVGGKGKKDSGEGEEELPMLNNPYSPACRAFEMLQTNLSFTVSDKELRVILVTSSSPGEGKSFVSANLAVAMSQLGKRVLLVDADMRRPRQHTIWNLSNFMGLSNILVNQAQLQSTTQEALVTLDVLPVGTTPPNPVALLDSQRMASLIQEATKEYDFVIIDTPPLTAVADALVVGKLVDGMLLVVRPGEVESGAVNTAKSLLEQAKVSILGMVVNGVGGGSSYGGYYYSKGYYGDKKGEKNENGKVSGIKIG
jgi:capsular exopolysaccharide synthesis family protein